MRNEIIKNIMENLDVVIGYGANQYGAIDRSGSMDSYDFSGKTYKEVQELSENYSCYGIVDISLGKEISGRIYDAQEDMTEEQYLRSSSDNELSELFQYLIQKKA